MARSTLATALPEYVRRGALARSRHGYSFHRGALDSGALTELASSVSSASTTWQPLEPVVGPVTQDAREHIAPVTGWLEALTIELATSGYIPERVRPELTYMLYPSRAGHVSPHRDSRGYVGLIMVASLKGTAEFAIHGSRDKADVLAQWIVGPGDVVVMAGATWSDRGGADARPFHSVRACERERMSATIRFTLK